MGKPENISIKLSAAQVAENAKKYGDENDDVIARAYREDKKIGDVWCSKNVEKYLRRYISDSGKANNVLDLKKAANYLQRMIEFAEENGLTEKEVIEKDNKSTV